MRAQAHAQAGPIKRDQTDGAAGTETDTGEDQVAASCIRDENLQAVECPAVSGRLRDGCREVRAVARIHLGDAQGDPKFPRRNGGQPFCLLLRRRMARDHVGRHERLGRRSRHQRPAELLEDQREVDEAEPHPAMGFRHGNREDAGLCQLAPHALVLPAGFRHGLGPGCVVVICQQTADGVLHLHLLGAELEIHRAPLSVAGRARARR